MVSIAEPAIAGLEPPNRSRIEILTGSSDPLRQFIRDVQGALATLSVSPSELLFKLPDPQRPYLVFELLDRLGGEEDRQLTDECRHFRPYVYHVDWVERDINDLKERNCLEPIQKLFAGDVVNATHLRQLIANYEAWRIPVGLEASGVIWDAWRNGVFLNSTLNPTSSGLFLRWERQDNRDLVEKLRSMLLPAVIEADSSARPKVNDKRYEEQFTTECCLVHQIPPDDISAERPRSSDLILVHYPLILDGFWFVGFAYFLMKADEIQPSLLANPDHYRVCLQELTKQHPSLKQFLKLRAMDLPDTEWNEANIDTVYRQVVLRYFACFNTTGPKECKLATFGDSALYLPPSWHVPHVLGLEWRVFVESLLEELRGEVEERKRHREQQLRLVQLRQDEATSRQMLNAVAHSIDTDLIASLRKLDDASLCLQDPHEPKGIESAKWYTDGAKACVRRVGEFAQAILQIQKHKSGTLVLPRTSFVFPDILIEDVLTFINHRSILRLSGPKERVYSLDRYLEANKGAASKWINAEAFTLLTYEILRAAVREILRNALRHVRPQIDAPPIKIHATKLFHGALITITNNESTDPAIVQSVNSHNEQPTQGQYGVALYKMIFKACGARWEMASENGWTTMKVTLPEVKDETPRSPGR